MKIRREGYVDGVRIFQRPDGSEKADCSLGTIGLFRAKELVEGYAAGLSLPASDHHILTQHQQILLALIQNAECRGSSRTAGKKNELSSFLRIRPKNTICSATEDQWR
ncbi:MAG: hypothetical protein SF339_16455 [Blastocatellia bacterium]|nr:hypothetical protein [Blastocatellia bacterium]